MFPTIKQVVAAALMSLTTTDALFAQTNTEDLTEDVLRDERTDPEQITDDRNTTLGARKASVFTIVGSYGIYSFLVSGKKGVQAGWIPNENWTLQLDYFKGEYGLKKYGLNLAEFEEKLVMLEARRYFGGTFNVIFGVGQREYRLELGSRILRYVEDEHIGDFSKHISVKRYVLDFGLGNRWQWGNGWTLGADWVSVHYPFGATNVDAGPIDQIEDADTRKNMHRLLSVLKYVPTFTLAKLNLGYTF